jgi:hypothetical protein
MEQREEGSRRGLTKTREERIATAKHNLDKLLSEQLAEYTKKQEQGEQRRRYFEKQRHLEQKAAQRRAQLKHKEIEQILQASKEIEEKRKRVPRCYTESRGTQGGTATTG